MMRCTATLAVLVLLSGGSVASAQESEAGAGKLEMGFFPGGGMIFVGGDDNLEVNFNTYDAGGWVTFHLNRLIAVEGEGSFGIGLAQDINYQNRIVKHVQTPGTMNVAGNIVVFPAGSDRLYAGYVTGGAGLLNLRSRKSTRQFGLDEHENFMATNFGGGLKIVRGGTGLANWGARIDYRIVAVGSQDDAVAFFAKSKTRIGHRIYVGFLYTLTR